jgi:catechol 2,3-dioxygenase-like lactoylglutathione lyase family enzyme
MSIEVRGVMTLLQVFDMPTSVRFYRDVLGFEVVHTTTPREGDQFDWGLLRLNDTELMLNTHRDTCLYFSCPDVDGAYRHLQAHGVEAEEPKIVPWGSKQCYLRDPDGYTLCFQWPAKED